MCRYVIRTIMQILSNILIYRIRFSGYYCVFRDSSLARDHSYPFEDDLHFSKLWWCEKSYWVYRFLNMRWMHIFDATWSTLVRHLPIILYCIRPKHSIHKVELEDGSSSHTSLHFKFGRDKDISKCVGNGIKTWTKQLAKDFELRLH